jgi:LysR family transcriptional regulator, glycine cleavage system transcriptional activator
MRSRWHDVPELKEMHYLSFREEIACNRGVISGQGTGLFSDVLAAPELQARTLVKAFDVSLPGYQFYLVHRPKHPREKIIEAFSTWLRSVTQ